MNIQELEVKMWNAAKSRDSQAFLEVVFHITSTWKKESDTWKLIFNMDSRIMQP